ncbi:hypothetical protein KYG33_01130 [Chryseobacterium sp. D764]|uniref:hypothetical protein n=1 Tax=unclassified Chryseobacterium TaxID=2593645 RepID=UPI000985E0D1|nr:MULTISPECIES: hypothetical protein [unclassified Chryseobacterium]QXU49679.1 hypothetical protein KYG33_01130 [Chryseobacterium sp. D764]CAD0225687.1 conserved membrane protein of unknown function [Chryseobacterium sp. JV274]
MKKLFNHLKFRFHQSFRLLNLNPRTGIPVLIILGVLVIMKLPESYYYPPLFFILALLFHYERKDIPFLKKVFVKSWRWIIVLETVFIYSILLCGNIHYIFEKTALLSLPMFALLAFITPRTQPWITFQWNFIPDDLFEWKSFLRKNTLLAVWGLVILWCSAYHFVALVLTGVFALDYISHLYEPNENKEMLEMYFKKYTLKEKLRRNSLLFNALLLPTYAMFLILNPAESLYILYYFAFMNLYCMLILTRKYKQYHHKEKSNYYTIGVFIEYTISSIIIIPAVFILKNNIKEASQNIKTYVGD